MCSRQKNKTPRRLPRGLKRHNRRTCLRVDIISLILRKDTVTVVRVAVELVPPTALLLYMNVTKKAISKIDDFLSKFSCKTIQNRKKLLKKGGIFLILTGV